MYPDRRLNSALLAVGILGLAASWMLIRRQGGIDDGQFLRSMIPHHAGAILMCKEATVTDPEIRALCEGIIAGQQTEIDQMKRMLAERRR
jgi:uncharacterized protein (DUF305 family)